MKYTIDAIVFRGSDSKQISYAQTVTWDSGIAFRLLLGMHDAFKDDEYFDDELVIEVNIDDTDKPKQIAHHFLVFEAETRNTAIIDGKDVGYKWDEYASMWF